MFLFIVHRYFVKEKKKKITLLNAKQLDFSFLYYQCRKLPLYYMYLANFNERKSSAYYFMISLSSVFEAKN